LRFESMGLEIECVNTYSPKEFGAQVPAEVTVSPAFSLAARLLAGQSTAFEFQAPRVSSWQQMTARYSSGRLRTALTAGGSVAVLVGALFFYQQWQLWGLESRWAKMAPQAKELQALQANNNQYRAWYDNSVKGLSILRTVSQAFPRESSVTAKTVEIGDLKTVSCTGVAKTYAALLQTKERLRALKQIRDVNLISTRGVAPAITFTFTFNWNQGGSNAN